MRSGYFQSALGISLLVAIGAFSLACATGRRTSGSNTEVELESAVQDYNREAKGKDRLICRTERPTGSHISRRVCRTVQQIEDDRENARRSVTEAVKENPSATVPR